MLVDGLSTPPGQLRAFARRALVLSPPELAPGPATGSRFAVFRLLHPVKVLGRFALAALRLIRSGRRRPARG
jgi:hypothetical protein